MNTHQFDEAITICTPIHGEKFEQMFELFKPVVLRWMPNARIIAHRYNPPERYKCPAHGGDWGKAEATSIYTKDGPIFIMDVDSVLAYPVRWCPENKAAVLSMSMERNTPILLPLHRGLKVIVDVETEAGLVPSGENVSVNPQFFWATENLLPLYERMELVFRDFIARHNRQDDEFMMSLTIWTLVYLSLRAEGRTEDFPHGVGRPYPVWHCPMPAGDRLSLYKILTDWMMKQPIVSPEFPPGSLFGI